MLSSILSWLASLLQQTAWLPTLHSNPSCGSLLLLWRCSSAHCGPTSLTLPHHLCAAEVQQPLQLLCGEAVQPHLQELLEELLQPISCGFLEGRRQVEQQMEQVCQDVLGGDTEQAQQVSPPQPGS